MFHFDNVADVNEWDDAKKLKFLRVRLTGRALRTLHHLPPATRDDYEATKAALKARFDPESRYTRYEAEFQARRKKPGEGWADFGEDLKSLADKAYPSLEHEARERLAINAYLQQLSPPQVAFAVRQKRPGTIDDAVAATLEMEAYAFSPNNAGVISTLQPSDEQPSIASIDPVAKLATIVERLTLQVETLQQETQRARQQSADARLDRRPRPGEQNRRGLRSRETFTGECWRCRQRGHIARNCTQPLPSQPQGN